MHSIYNVSLKHLASHGVHKSYTTSSNQCTIVNPALLLKASTHHISGRTKARLCFITWDVLSRCLFCVLIKARLIEFQIQWKYLVLRPITQQIFLILFWITGLPHFSRVFLPNRAGLEMATSPSCWFAWRWVISTVLNNSSWFLIPSQEFYRMFLIQIV